jgi:hypothetical protein
MSFVYGFSKIAAEPFSFGPIAKALKEGLISSGKQTVGDTLKLKGIKSFGEAARASGGAGNLVSTQKGRERLAKAVGEASPSLAVGGAYAAALKKGYDRFAKPDPSYEGY